MNPMHTHRFVGMLCWFALGTAFAACSSDENAGTFWQHGTDAGVDTSLQDVSVDAKEAASGDAASEAAQEAAVDVVEEPVDPTVLINAIKQTAGDSTCYDYQWKDRGQAPKGYIQGVALVFARAVCNPSRSDVVVVSKAKTTDDAHDALSWYAAIFSGLSMDNSVAGVDTLRHAYTLLLGLGMRESSGEYCCGRDMSATNTSADTAEAGGWQTSYNSHVFSPELPKLFEQYKADSSGCWLDIFSANVTCSASNWESYGSGDGFDFQELEKKCPAFAAEYAAVMLRVSGGSAGHYGPLRTRAAEVRPECDAMFKQVQTLVEQSPSSCGSI
jgi:hypothetical protein